MLAPVLAAIALIAAAAGAVVPSAHEQMRYSWPPASAASVAAPTRLWATPLLLQRRSAERIDIDLSCALPPPLPRAAARDSEPLVLSTTRFWSAGGIQLQLRTPHRLTLGLDGDQVTRFTWPPPDAGPNCRRSFIFRGLDWSLADENGRRLASGVFGDEPVVNGFFSNLDVRRPGVSASVTTHAYRVVLGTAQKAADVIAAILALLALGLATRVKRPRFGRVSLATICGHLRRLRPVDAMITAFLLVWWMVGPSYYDDGWVRARQLNYSASDVFSNYYDTWGGILPDVHWLEWIQHWFTLASGSLAVMRIFPLLAGFVTWGLCRVALRRAVGAEAARGFFVETTLAAGFLLGFYAWGMTIRPEPEVAILMTGSLIAALSFTLTPSLTPIAVFGVLTALAVTAHPAGIVTFGPGLAVIPTLWRWLRAGDRRILAGASTIVLASGALLIVLLFLGTDAEWWRQQEQLFSSTTEHGSTWYDELTRYDLLSSFGYGSAVRRASIGFYLLAVLSFLVRRVRSSRSTADIPAISLLTALGLFVFTPSKWPWHFGVLIGLGAVAFASETARLVADARSDRWRISARPFAAIALVILVCEWAWHDQSGWGELDLRTLGWSPLLDTLTGVHAADHLSLGSLKEWLFLTFVLLTALTTWERARRRGWPLGRAGWVVAATIPVIIAMSFVVDGAGTLTRDALITKGWTLTRQNVDGLLGKRSCGLGDSLTVPDPSSLQPVGVVGEGRLPATRDTETSFERPFWSGTTPTSPQAKPIVSRWYDASKLGRTRIGLLVSGVAEAPAGLVVQWGRRGPHGKIRVKTDSPVTIPDYAHDISPWEIVAQGDLPARPRRGRYLRLIVSEPPGGGFVVSAPVRYHRHPIERTSLTHPGSVLVVPVFYTYFPCASPPPVLDRGVVQMPLLSVLQGDDGWPLDAPASPFNGLVDVRGVIALSIGDSGWRPRVSVYATRPLPRGYGVLAATAVKRG